MSILVSFGEFFGEFFPPSHPCVCDTLLDIFIIALNHTLAAKNVTKFGLILPSVHMAHFNFPRICDPVGTPVKLDNF